MKESKFQSDLISELNNLFPGCVILKNDATYMQGIPDLSIFYKDKWAMLECKEKVTSKKRPNQEYYVDKLNKMSFSSFVYPENKDEVIRKLVRLFSKGDKK